MNIFVSQPNGGDDVMIINTTMKPRQIAKALLQSKQDFIEVYEVPDNELGVYLYDPLFANEKFDKNIGRLVELFDKSGRKIPEGKC